MNTDGEYQSIDQPRRLTNHVEMAVSHGIERTSVKCSAAHGSGLAGVAGGRKATRHSDTELTTNGEQYRGTADEDCARGTISEALGPALQCAPRPPRKQRIKAT